MRAQPPLPYSRGSTFSSNVAPQTGMKLPFVGGSSPWLRGCPQGVPGKSRGRHPPTPFKGGIDHFYPSVAPQRGMKTSEVEKIIPTEQQEATINLLLR